MDDQKLNILIVDDDNDDVELIQESISKVADDTKFLTAENGLESLALLKKLKDEELPQLIILDHNMPRLNGSEVLLLLCKEDRYLKIPKVIFTTSPNPALIAECMANGATDFFVKPSRIEEYKQFAKHVVRLCKAS